MATIEIDGKAYEAEAGQMLIDVADANGIDIPRFCYHKKLSVAANCRMCLVDVEKAPKPMPACATPIMDGMKILTRSTKALTAQKAVMEFLLINHPLDCPICDQGGECELQDVAVGYGRDVSRYSETKRVVGDKNIGPLIATEMTRCIHCTRCVRFSTEITGVQEMGGTGRGEHTLIGTYIESTVDSELSANMIDLCPVGALTSKPYQYSARPWEMQQKDTIAAHDAIGSNMHVHVRGNEVMRVVPKENDALNEVWLSDRDRFSYQGLTAADRLTSPMIKKGDHWQKTDWETALNAAIDSVKASVEKHGANQLGVVASATATLEELYLLQKIARGLGSQNIDHRLSHTDFSDQTALPAYPHLGQTFAELETVNAALVIGSHVRKEQPLTNHRLHKAYKAGAKIMQINPINFESNYPLAETVVAADMVNAVAGVVKALLADKTAPEGVADLVANVDVSAQQQAIADALNNAEVATVLVGQLASSHPAAANLRALAAIISQLSGAHLGYLAEANNTAGAYLAGVLPHREVAGKASAKAGLDVQAMFKDGLKSYLLLGTEPELDSANGAQALASLKAAETVVALTAFSTPALESYATVMLPIALFAETSGTYINNEGTAQSFAGVVAPQGEARPAWKLLRVFGNLFDLTGFNYVSSEEVRDDILGQLDNTTPDNTTAYQLPQQLNGINKGIQRLTELPIYAADSLTRRAEALQATQDASTAQGVHINAALASQLKLGDNDPVKVSQEGAQVSLPVVIDDRVPDNCALIYAAQAASVKLGAWHGTVELTASA